MKAITLRNLPAEVEREIRRRAEEKGISTNKAVIGLLEEHLEIEQKGKKKRHHDLDHLHGAWTKKQSDEFDTALKDQREIDPELWH